jgi:hypothetical protein
MSGAPSKQGLPSKQGVQGIQGIQGKQILPPHKKPANAEEFLASLKPVERKLQELAAEKLGSSYFMEKTSAYKKWLTLSAPKSKI